MGLAGERWGTAAALPTAPDPARAPVLVTGGASGLGAAVVAALVARGTPVVVLDRTAPAAEVPHLLVDLADGRAAERADLAATPAAGLAGVVTCLDQPAGCVVRELVVTALIEPSWP